MKKKLTIFLIAILSVVMLAGCKPEESDKLQIYASIFPVYDFTRKIAGDKADVHLIVPFGTEAHNYDPETAIIAKLTKADMLVYSGAGMEFWIDKILDQLPEEKPLVIRASDGITLLESDHHHHHNDHDEDDLTTIYDPHVWLSPLNAKKQIKNIYLGLIKMDPDNQDYYQLRYDFYSSMADLLHSLYQTTLENLSRNIIMVSHEAFGYLANEYNLEQYAIEGLNKESEPSPADIVNAVNFALDNNIRVIFYEESMSKKNAETIATEIIKKGGTAKVDKLTPIESITKVQHDNGVDYFDLMLSNLLALKEALR